MDSYGLTKEDDTNPVISARMTLSIPFMSALPLSLTT